MISTSATMNKNDTYCLVLFLNKSARVAGELFVRELINIYTTLQSVDCKFSNGSMNSLLLIHSNTGFLG